MFKTFVNWIVEGFDLVDLSLLVRQGLQEISIVIQPDAGPAFAIVKELEDNGDSIPL